MIRTFLLYFSQLLTDEEMKTVMEASQMVCTKNIYGYGGKSP